MKQVKHFLLLLIAVSASLSLYASYVTNQPITLTQPDGAKIDLYASGDEFYNWVHDKDGFTIIQDAKGWYVYAIQDSSGISSSSYIAGKEDPSSKGIQPLANKPAVEIGLTRQTALEGMISHDEGRAPHSGTLNNVVIFIRFSDQPEFTENISSYNDRFNGSSGSSLQSYFNEASYNQLNISTSFYPIPGSLVVSWQDNHPRGYYNSYHAISNPMGYSGGANGTERIAREHALLANAVNAISAVIPESLNIDADGDGKVDNVCFIIQGNSDGWSDLLWPHRWSLYSQSVYINGKRVYDYNFQLSQFIAVRGVGVLCHEMFHSLGAPDLYHYYPNGINPVGGWDVMEMDANPPQHMSAYMKYKYGHWIDSIPVISTPGTYTLNSLVNPTNNCFRINSTNSSQYYIVEYRKKTGLYESSVPGSGIVVYRINNATSGNAIGPPDEVYVYRPNGSSTVNGDIVQAAFSEDTGRSIFNRYTNPSPFLATGEDGDLSLQCIGSTDGNSISFTLCDLNPMDVVSESFENGFASLPWIFSADTEWSVDTTQFFQGSQSAKSGVVTHNQTTFIQTNITSRAGQISFFYKVSSESGSDFLKFYIDGVLKRQWLGEIGWSMTAFNIPAGEHTLRWEYTKNGMHSSGSDCAWIDHIAYPEVVFDPPQNLVAELNDGIISLNWQAPVSVTPAGYKIYRNGSYLATETSLTYLDQTSDTDTCNSFYITAIYDSPTGESVPSHTVYNNSVIAIGTGTDCSSRPITSSNGYVRTANLYLESEISVHGIINGLAWYPTIAPAAAIPTKIYLKTTPASILTSNTWESMLSDATLVYDDDVSTLEMNVWQKLCITDYLYLSNNLLVLVECNYGSNGTGSIEGSGYTYSLSGDGMEQSWQQNASAPTGIGIISSNRPNIQLTIGVVAALAVFSINTYAVDFGYQTISSQSSPRLLTIANIGGSMMSISSITGSNGSNFSITDENIYPKNLNTGESMPIYVTFTALEPGVMSGTLEILETQSDQVHVVYLTGTGYDPTISVFPYEEGFESALFPPLGWENVPIAPAIQGFDIQNLGMIPTCTPFSGTAMARYSSHSLSSGSTAFLASPPFRLIQDQNFRVKFRMYRDEEFISNADSLNVFLSPGHDLTNAVLLGTIHRAISYLPIVESEGWYEYSFDLPINQEGQAQFILLEASSNTGSDIFIDEFCVEEVVLMPQFSINQSNLDFGCVNMDNSSVRILPVTISNTGTSVLTGVITTPAAFQVCQATTSLKDPLKVSFLPYTVAAQSSVTFNLYFTPTIADVVSSNVVITSNDAGNSNYIIYVSGIGFVSPQAQFENTSDGWQLSWNMVIGAIGYRIYRSDSPSGAYLFVAAVHGNNYMIPSTSQTGFYKVTAISEPADMETP